MIDVQLLNYPEQLAAKLTEMERRIETLERKARKNG